MKFKSKNSFLKRISCIALSLMLCLTSFTLAGFVPTVEAEAATVETTNVEVLGNAMREFESKMDGGIYQNMGVAYDAYVAASKAYDAAYYGGDTTTDVTTPAENLTQAMLDMHKWSAYKGTATGFYGETVATEGYTNLLYCSKNIGYGSEVTANNMVNKIDAPSKSVMLYDGTETGFPVVLEIKRNNSLQRDARYVAVANSSFKLTHNWYGYLENDWTHWPAKTASSNKGQLSYSSSVSQTWTLTTETTRYFNNQCFYNGAGNTNDYYDFYDKNLSFTGCHNRKGETCTSTLINSSEYVVNYKALIDKMPNSDSRLDDVENYKEGGLKLTVFNAVKDPNSYFVGKDDNSVDSAVKLLAGDIKDFVSGKDSLTIDNQLQYPALRKAMDNAMSTYKSGRGNYTYRSYNQFKTAYEKAQNLMKSVKAAGYADGSYAKTAAENLTKAYNNLETPKANITFENLFSFEDFYDSNSAGKGGLTSASFDRANKTIAFEGTGDVSTVHGGENLYMIPVEPGKTYRLELDVEASDDYSLRYCDVMAFLPNEAGTSYDENHVSWRGYSSPTWKNDSTHKSIEFTIPADYPTERSKIFFRFGAIYDTENNDKRKVTATYKNIVFYDVEREAERGDLTDLRVTEISVTPGQKYGDLPSPTREGYVFKGWYTDKEFTNQVTSDSIAVASQTAVNLYAKWHSHNFENQITISNNGNIYTWNGECTCGETQELSSVDASAYVSAVAAAQTDIANTVKYSSDSIASLQTVLTKNTLTFANEPVLTQQDVKTATTNIILADQLKTVNNNGVLELATYTVTFNTVNEDKTTEDNVFEKTYEYGSVVSLKAEGVYPYKWTRDGDNLVAGSTDEFTLVVTGNTVVNAYYYSQTAPENQHVVTVYNRQGKIIGCFYVDDNATLTVEGSTISCGKQSVTPEKLPFYQVTGYTVEGGANAKGYAVTSDIKVYAKYSPQTEITITLDNTNANIYFENDSTKSETTKTVVWDKKVTVKSESDVIWLVNGKAVAKGPSYTFRASNSITISTQEIATESPSSVITYAEFDAENNKARIAVSNYSSDNFRIKEQGIIFGTTTNMNPDLTVKQLAEKGKKYVATKTTDTGNQFSYTLTFTSTTKKMLCVISYVTYNDNTTVYSDRVTYVTIN